MGKMICVNLKTFHNKVIFFKFRINIACLTLDDSVNYGYFK